MSAVTYLFPVLVFVGVGLWYLRMYQKGKALGGGIAAGFVQAQKDKWGELLAPGENISVQAHAVLWRPAWQYALAHYFRFLRLVWPMTTYQLLVTDRGRVLLASYGVLGGLNDKEAHEGSAVRVSEVTEQPVSWLMKMNPLMSGTNLTAFIATLNFPNKRLRLSRVSGDFVNALPR